MSTHQPNLANRPAWSNLRAILMTVLLFIGVLAFVLIGFGHAGLKTEVWLVLASAYAIYLGGSVIIAVRARSEGEVQAAATVMATAILAWAAISRESSPDDVSRGLLVLDTVLILAYATGVYVGLSVGAAFGRSGSRSRAIAGVAVACGVGIVLLSAIVLARDALGDVVRSWRLGG